MRVLGMALMAVVFLGCTKSLAPPAPRLAMLPDVPAPVTAPAVVVAPVLPMDEMIRLEQSEPTIRLEDPTQIIAEANARATVSASRGRFDGAILRWSHIPGNLYRVEVGVDAPLTIIIPEDEDYVMSAGLDHRWILKIPEDRLPGTPLHILLIAPEAKLKGRLTLVTSRAALMMEVRSREHGGLAAVTWALPTAYKPPYDFLAPGEYRVGYDVAITSGQPIWAPTSAQVWDVPKRGKTLILFPPERLTHDAPTFYVIGRDGAKQLTNYRVRGQWYEVDRLFERAELRVGHDEYAEVVTITRGQGYRQLRCPGAAECPPGRCAMRGLLAALFRPRTPAFQGRQRAPGGYGLRKWVVRTIVIVMGLVVVAWLNQGWFTSKSTAEKVTKVKTQPADPPPALPEFPHEYRAKLPVLPPVTAPDAKVEKDDTWKVQMQAQLAVLQELVKQQQAQLEANAKKSTDTKPDANAVAAKKSAEEAKKAREQAAKALQEARRNPLFHEARHTKDATVGVQSLTNPYTLSAGWLLPILIEDAITNQAPGIAKFVIRSDVKDSATGEHTLVPQGTTGLLRTTGGQLPGTTRFPVTVLSMTLPNGDFVKLPGAHASDQSGKAGFRDQVDNRWLEKFSSILIMSVLKSGTYVSGSMGGGIPERVGGTMASETAQQGQQQVRQVIDTSTIFNVRNGYLGSIRMEEPLVLGKPYGP